MAGVSEHKTARAKKAHGCHWCGQRIEPGELYVKYRWWNGGDAGTNKMHPECDEACNEAAREEGGWIDWLPGDNERPEPAERAQGVVAHA